ncbi:MAG: 3-oxoacyl-[acyl-carrier-protein] synthase [Burkholderiales bacterium]
MVMPDIRTLLPHSGAMVLLDRVVSADEESLCAEVRIRPDSMFCGTDGVGAWVGIEYMAQTVAAHAGHLARLRGEPVKIGFLLGSRRYQCTRSMFTIGGILRVHVRRELQAENGLASFECWIDAQEERIATATVTVFQPDNANDFLKETSNE